MIVLDSAKLEHWTPDFSSSGQQNPDWVRLRFRDQILANALNWVDWSENPAQVEICEQCGIVQCASGGYVHVSRLGDLIFWTRPTPARDDDWAGTEYAASCGVQHFGAIAIPVETWQAWRRATALPDADDLPCMTGEVLTELWLSGIPRPLRCSTLEEVVPMLRRDLLAADTLDVASAIHNVDRLIGIMLGWIGRPMRGSIKSVATAGAVVENLYFDGPGFEEWPAIATLHGDYVPALSRDWIAVLDPSP